MPSTPEVVKKTTDSIYNWVRLSSPEQLEQEGEKYIYIRLLNMFAGADVAEREEIEQCAVLVKKIQTQAEEITQKVRELEKQLGV